MHRALAATIAATALFAALPAQAQDGLFGSFFSRPARTEAPKVAAGAETRDREGEARNLRREYWERERARLAQTGDRGMSNPVSNRAVAAR